jgi:CheY-like chemotaxis protein
LYDAIVDALAFQEHSGKEKPAEPPQQAGSINLNGVRVLLAEDNAVNRFVASELLAITGCTCTMVVNGREALETAIRESFDVILMDCQMPELDGFEASRAIREAEKRAGDGQRRPIIALTANAIVGDREFCLAAGMDDYVTKPIDAVELFSAIRRQLPADRLEAIGSPAVTAPAPIPVEVSSVNTNAAPPVDLSSLEQRCMGNRKLASKALKIFDVGLVKDVGLLLESVSKGDAKAAAASAHKIKGSAANVSAEQVRVVAAELEKLAKSDSLAQANDALAQLDIEVRRFQEFLSTALTNLVPSTDQPATPTSAREPK